MGFPVDGLLQRCQRLLLLVTATPKLAIVRTTKVLAPMDQPSGIAPKALGTQSCVADECSSPECEIHENVAGDKGLCCAMCSMLNQAECYPVPGLPEGRAIVSLNLRFWFSASVGNTPEITGAQ